MLFEKMIKFSLFYTHTHTHTHTYIYIFNVGHLLKLRYDLTTQ